ncbi:hypothetical protein I6A60_37720 [Frankia sp. AgB1.9]|uniref:hypothetical protein n=1 Tax=unclassified Frankia TaxID=2632575 RepID=UPI00193248D4|nr:MULTISPECIES: hypothetical protein [unclassified Frankia]MBL7494393.1 hypothetical protein [Frankia sp. AgW1.1]MBL7553537.1 hypothetical protein [Frankia sp. AgB1.9]MBL7622462.1 hypothetical protein [Frankia sp. AgB1.8]
MAAAVFTATASLVIALAGFYLNQRSTLLMSRQQARLGRVNAQIQELYGPLLALSDVNETLWEALRSDGLPSQRERHSATLNEQDQREWDRWRRLAFMPTNRQMKDLIINRADLIVEGAVPAPLLQFCAHVTAEEVLLSDDGAPASGRALVGHPGAAFVDYIHDTFTTLKAQQGALVNRIGSD